VLGVALAATVVGLIFLFVIPWVGFIVGAIGLILLLVYVLGAVRRPVTHEERPS
jgi:hypothetical protein